MRLRNKRTGEIQDNVELVMNKPFGEKRQYESLSEFVEDWEDYKPKAPLIKDEKIRKAVRAWADMNKIEKAGIQKIITEARGLEDSWYQITGQDKNGCLWKIEIHASYSETVSKDYKENMVTIAELCREDVK